MCGRKNLGKLSNGQFQDCVKTGSGEPHGTCELGESGDHVGNPHVGQKKPDLEVRNANLTPRRFSTLAVMQVQALPGRQEDQPETDQLDHHVICVVHQKIPALDGNCGDETDKSTDSRRHSRCYSQGGHASQDQECIDEAGPCSRLQYIELREGVEPLGQGVINESPWMGEVRGLPQEVDEVHENQSPSCYSE